MVTVKPYNLQSGSQHVRRGIARTDQPLTLAHVLYEAGVHVAAWLALAALVHVLMISVASIQ